MSTDTIEFNGDEFSPEAFRSATEFMANTVSREPTASRGDFMQHLGQQYGGDRDIYEVLGYKDEISEEQYRAKYERQDVANIVVERPANDTWRYAPTVTDNPDTDEESDFEQRFNEHAEDVRLFHYLRRADIASRIGEYGVLFIGFEDSANVSDEPSNVNDVAYLSPFAQDKVTDWTLGKEVGRDVSDPRYNLPVSYSLDFGKGDNEDIQDVHWKRVIHIAEGTVESDLKGSPPLKPIYNRLDDREKVLGSSAEMFWSGADRKYHFNIDSENTTDIPDDELSKLDDEVQKLVHEMEPYIKTFNTDLDVLDGQEVDPSGVIDAIDRSIAGQTGIPQRMLTGSEAAELASTQDRATWYGRVETRQNQHAEPSILRPYVARVQEYGVVPEPQGGAFAVLWPNLFELNELEETEAMENRAQALARLAPQGNTDLVAEAEELFKFVVDGHDPDFETANQTPMSEQQNQPSQSDPTEAES